MMKPKRVSFTPVTGAANNIATSQTPTTGFTLNGALCSGGVLPEQTLGYIVVLTTAADETATPKTITITGTSQDGKAQTENVTAPNATTAASTKFYKSVSSITCSVGFLGAATVGTSNATLCAATPTYCVDMGAEYTTLAADIGGTINFTLQKCYERPTAGETPNWITAQAAGAVDVQTLITGPVGAARGQINSYTNGATFAMSILQAD